MFNFQAKRKKKKPKRKIVTEPSPRQAKQITNPQILPKKKKKSNASVPKV